MNIAEALQRYFESRRQIWREATNPQQKQRVQSQTKARRKRSRRVRVCYLHV